MRVFILALAFLAVPALAAAQQADLSADPAAPTVQLEQSASETADAPAPQLQEVTLEERSVTPDEAALQEEGPASTEWWYLVGAIVVGGIILAVLL